VGNEQLVASFPPRRPGFAPGSGQVGFVVNKVALKQVSSEYFGSPANLRSTKFSILTITRGKYNRPEVADRIKKNGKQMTEEVNYI
jgi:hypothetical protein